MLQARVEMLYKEKADMTQDLEREGEFKINRLNQILNKLTQEKKKLQEFYSYEVRQKQELVLALAKEKKSLATELQSLLKDVRKSKQKIKKHTGGAYHHSSKQQEPSP
jgi:uncharacterized protein YukE